MVTKTKINASSFILSDLCLKNIILFVGKNAWNPNNQDFKDYKLTFTFTNVWVITSVMPKVMLAYNYILAKALFVCGGFIKDFISNPLYCTPLSQLVRRVLYVRLSVRWWMITLNHFLCLLSGAISAGCSWTAGCWSTSFLKSLVLLSCIFMFGESTNKITSSITSHKWCLMHVASP